MAANSTPQWCPARWLHPHSPYWLAELLHATHLRYQKLAPLACSPCWRRLRNCLPQPQRRCSALWAGWSSPSSVWWQAQSHPCLSDTALSQFQLSFSRLPCCCFLRLPLHWVTQCGEDFHSRDYSEEDCRWKSQTTRGSLPRKCG